MSRNIRSLCNTTHSNERYVPITGYRRHTVIAQGQNMLIHSLTTDLPLRMMSMMDGKAPKGCATYTSVDKTKCGFESIPKTCRKRYVTLQKLQHRKPIMG